MTILCVVLIRSQINTYQENRITTTIATTAFPILKVPFPAVTICNFNVVYKSNVNRFRKLMKHVADTDIDEFFSSLASLIPVININYQQIPYNDYNNITLFLEMHGYDTDRLMAELAQPCYKLLKACYWKSKEIDCNRIFHRSKTSSGYCCSFNYDHAVEDNDLLKANGRVFGSGTGPAFSLEVHLDPEIDQYMSSIDLIKGVDVLLHESNAFPDLQAFTTMIAPGSEVSFVVKPEVIETDPKIRDINKAIRGCAFEEELQADWFQTYSYPTCKNECKSRAFLELCGCVPFYYPQKKGARYCNLTDLMCISKGHWNQKDQETDNLFEIENEEHTIEQIMERTMTCNCYPQCNEVSYSYQVDLESSVDVGSLANTSVLSVYFGRATCMKFLRSQFLTWELIVASIGGSIGLCLGGSILSVVEFLYHIFDAIFSKYNQTRKSTKVNYEPKLYLNDFKEINYIQLANKKTKFPNRKLQLFKNDPVKISH